MGWRNPGRWMGRALAAGWLLAAPSALATGEDVSVREVTCSLPALFEDLRVALKTGSPELQRYMKELVKEAGLAMPPAELLAAIERERDPAVLESLGAALAGRASNLGDLKLLRPLLERAMRDGEPGLRAAAVRALRGSASVDVLAANADVASYAQLIRDASPEVREAVVGNLTHESAKVYYGHNGPVADAAVALAAATEDPNLAATLLREVSMEQVGAEGVRDITRRLQADSPSLRSAAASALGGVPAAHAAGAQEALTKLYREEKSPEVRKAILQSIAQLGLAGAVPTLQSLRGVDASLAPEVDAWLTALRIPVQEWSLIRREKERLRK